MGGLGGKGNPSRASSDRRRPQAVPVATKEATGIDSRDEGVPFPPITADSVNRAGRVRCLRLREAGAVVEYLGDLAQTQTRGQIALVVQRA